MLRDNERPVSADMYGRPTEAPPPLLLHLDPLDPTAATETLGHVREMLGTLHHALVLPAKGVVPPAGTNLPKAASLVEADEAVVQQFLRNELGGAVAAARLLARFWSELGGDYQHRVLFVTNLDDGRGNGLATILRRGRAALSRLAARIGVAAGPCAARRLPGGAGRTGGTVTLRASQGLVQPDYPLYKRRSGRPGLRGGLGRAAFGQCQAPGRR